MRIIQINGIRLCLVADPQTLKLSTNQHWQLSMSRCYKTFCVMANFYCKKVCGDPDFSIEEWNKAFKYCEDAGIEGIERDKILSPELFPCETQCESCMNEVLDTQIKNRKLREERAKANVL